jgi:ribosomal protein S18 acetylase RimI-like enzyme
MPALCMSQARPDQLALIMELLTEVSAWLTERGIAQWPSPPEPEIYWLMEREIARGEVYLAQLEDDDRLAGLLRFEWHDPYLWPGDPNGGGYVHSLGVRPGYHGQHVGAAMLRWAAEHVHVRGRRYLRLDCVAGNQTLRRYYEGLGFHFRGVAGHGDYTGALFELDLDHDLGAGAPAPETDR